ncbi:MAG TPA: hypothetical protein VGJ44_07635 [Kribbellaceae bacterium]|jgi:hypothetical protein
MARQLPIPAQQTRIIHYVGPAPQQDLILHTAAEVAAYRAAQRQLRARGVQRQHAITDHDRKVRRFWLGFGAVFALALLAALVVLGWLIWTVVGLGVLAVPVVIGLTVALAAGGHRCITIMQHMH